MTSLTGPGPLRDRIGRRGVSALSGLPDHGPQGVWSAPGFSLVTLVAHAVAVGTQEGEIVELGLGRPGDMEGQGVVNLDVPVPEVAVEALEVKGADLAPDGLTLTASLPDLAVAEAPVALPVQRPPGQQPSFRRSRLTVVAGFVGLRRDPVEFSRCDAEADSFSGSQHLCRVFQEVIDDIPRW